MSRLRLVLVLTLLVGQTFAQIPERPSTQRLVNDFVGLLSKNEQQRLERKLVAYDDSTSTQIAIVIVASTKGDDINLFAAQIGEKWGVGDAKKDNGILVCVASEDRKMAIQTGRGVDQFLTAYEVKVIIDQVITPAFREGRYARGLDDGTDALMTALNGEFKGNGGKKSRKIPFAAVIGLLLILFILSRVFRGGGGGGGGFLIGPGGGHWHGGGFGGGFGGGGGGGFGGFGGGSFGGGGASGSW